MSIIGNHIFSNKKPSVTKSLKGFPVIRFRTDDLSICIQICKNS